MTIIYETSSHHLPDEQHAADDDWNEFEVVNDPSSGKKLPNEGHAADDDWNEFEVVNDPSSGKKLPNEGHAQLAHFERNLGLTMREIQSTLYVTEQFWQDIQTIYGNFTAHDPEYPALGITIEGAPIFVECIRFPDEAIIRRPASDEVRGDHPSAHALWESVVHQYNGKCRRSTVHIHPMNLPTLSGTDVRNFENLRLNPQDPSTFGVDQPYPVILVNLTASRKLELLGFWVNHGIAHRTRVKCVADDDIIVTEAWKTAQPLPYFSEEACIVRRIHHRLTGRKWTVELGVNPATQAKAIKAHSTDGRRVLLRFTHDAPLGLATSGSATAEIRLEDYVDWARLFDDLAPPAKRLKPSIDTTMAFPAADENNPQPVCERIDNPSLDPVALSPHLESLPQRPASLGLNRPLLSLHPVVSDGIYALASGENS